MENFPSPSNQVIGHSGIQKEEEQTFLSINISEVETSTVETTNDSQVPENEPKLEGQAAKKKMLIGKIPLDTLTHQQVLKIHTPIALSISGLLSVALQFQWKRLFLSS